MREALISICAAAIITAIYKALIPSDKFISQIKLLTACFFILSAVSAVSGLNDAWDISDIIVPDGSYNDYSVQIGTAVSEETVNILRRNIYEKLAEENIFPEKIYIDINISDNSRISINEIKLVFDENDYNLYAERAVVLIRKLAGTTIKVTAEKTPQTAGRGTNQ